MENEEGTNLAPPVMGRPTKYRPEYCREILEHFNVDFTNAAQTKPVPLNFLSAFARKIGVCRDTLGEWTKVHPDFSDAYKKAKALQKEHLITCALLGLFPPAAFIFTAKNITDMRDKFEQKQVVVLREGPKLTVGEIRAGLDAEEAVGTGLDMRSIEGEGSVDDSDHDG